MARFDYECERCGVFEVVQSVFDDKLTTCPSCDSSVKRLIGGVAFHIKGASSANGYASIPTNEQLGMESETSLLRKTEDEFYMEGLKLGRPLNTTEREIYKDELAAQKRDYEKENKRIAGLKEKHPEFVQQVTDSLDKVKNEPEWKKNKQKEQRNKDNMRGTRKVTEKDFQGANLDGVGKSKIFKD